MSLLGQMVPMLIAVVTIPQLIHGLGIDRFGVLSLAWILVGYFGLFDLGLSSAVTRLVSIRLPERRESEVPALVWTSLGLLLALGLAGSLVACALSPWLVGSVLKIPAALQGDALGAFFILAASLPVITGMAGLSGVLAAQQRFDLLNAVRIPMGALTFLGPLMVLPFSTSLAAVVMVLVSVRLVAWAALLLLCLHTLPTLRRGFQFDRSLIRPLLNYGGWMTVSGVVSPAMVYVDRFLIGAMVSMASVAYYTTPYDLATRLWLLSSPAVSVLFPAFAASYAVDRARTSRLFRRGLQYILIVLFPCSLVLVTIAPEGLTFWLGADFARHSAPVLQLLAIGVFVNGLAQLAIVLVQSVGRPDLSARLHLLELPLYLGGVVWLISARGIEGAAIAWVARVTLDGFVLFTMAHRLLRRGAESLRPEILMFVGAIVLLILPMFTPARGVRMVILAVGLLATAIAAWGVMRDPAMRAMRLHDLGAAGTAP